MAIRTRRGLHEGRFATGAAPPRRGALRVLRRLRRRLPPSGDAGGDAGDAPGDVGR